MKFSNAVEAGYRNYFNFSGRAGRAEFWWFWLWDIILTAVFAGFLISGLMLLRQHAAGAIVVLLISLIFGIALLGTIIPIYAVQVRRLHDAGHSGWWIGGEILLSAFRGGLHAAMRHNPASDLFAISLVSGLIWLGVSIAIFVFLVQPSRGGQRGYSRY